MSVCVYVLFLKVAIYHYIYSICIFNLVEYQKYKQVLWSSVITNIAVAQCVLYQLFSATSTGIKPWVNRWSF